MTEMNAREIQEKQFMLSRAILCAEKPESTHRPGRAFCKYHDTGLKQEKFIKQDGMHYADLREAWKLFLFQYEEWRRTGYHVTEVSIFANVWDQDSQTWHFEAVAMVQIPWTAAERIKRWWNRRLDAMKAKVRS